MGSTPRSTHRSLPAGSRVQDCRRGSGLTTVAGRVGAERRAGDDRRSGSHQLLSNANWTVSRHPFAGRRRVTPVGVIWTAGRASGPKEYLFHHSSSLSGLHTRTRTAARQPGACDTNAAASRPSPPRRVQRGLHLWEATGFDNQPRRSSIPERGLLALHGSVGSRPE